MYEEFLSWTRLRPSSPDSYWRLLNTKEKKDHNSEGDVLRSTAWEAQRCFQMQWPSKVKMSFSIVLSLSRRARGRRLYIRR